MFRMKTSVKQTIDNSADLLKGIRLLEKNEVLVGVPAANAERHVDRRTKINNAALLYIHNYGSPINNIPARPSMEPGIKDAQSAITKRFRNAGEAALDGKPDVTMKEFHAAGLAAELSIKNKINSNIPPPLAASTLAARRRRGHSSTRTLVEFGEMRNAVTHVVRAKT
jgi:hypothetical protein